MKAVTFYRSVMKYNAMCPTNKSEACFIKHSKIKSQNINIYSIVCPNFGTKIEGNIQGFPTIQISLNKYPNYVMDGPNS